MANRAFLWYDKSMKNLKIDKIVEISFTDEQVKKINQEMEEYRQKSIAKCISEYVALGYSYIDAVRIANEAFNT